ncbi:MAG: hypothetical protein ACFFED_13705 [Candidatus Thorarchaeota archaeon]
MNREDVLAFRWPEACLSCGQMMLSDGKSRYAILGMFHEAKDTQILLKLAGFFYMCNRCEDEIEVAVDNPSRKISSLAMKLREHPWNEFIALEKDGSVRVPEGPFRNKLSEMNPEAIIKTHNCPMTKLRQLVTKG